MKQLFTRLFRHQRGVALIEFAIVFPFMFLLLFGGIELARYIMIIQKVEKAAYVVTDIAGQFPPATAPVSPQPAGEISVTQLEQNVFPQLHRMLGIYGDTTREAVILTSVVKKPNGQLKVRWQRSVVGSFFAGGNTVTSVVTGQAPVNETRAIATPPATCADAPFNGTITPLLISMMPGENMLVGEVFFRYRPIVGVLFGVSNETPQATGGFSISEQTIGRRLFLHPRGGDLLDLPPAYPFGAGDCP